jgi:hypothetical protein
MTIVAMDYLHNLVRRPTRPGRLYRRFACRLRTSTTKLTLILLSVLLLCGSIAAFSLRSSLLAANLNKSCGWYTVRNGDTLTNIASQYHTTISVLAHANGIHNVNLIFVSQRLCLPHSLVHQSGGAGILPNGVVRWYDYQDLDWSNRSQVHKLLYRVATDHRLPPRLLLAIAWQESGWTQHVIAWDGGIGVMQLMPYTAQGINSGIGQQLSPYDLSDNLNLGATYLEWLWNDFHGNLPRVISAYNEGGWSVQHRGIFNWNYVNNVMALMQRLN